jgi:hypothetical protein
MNQYKMDVYKVDIEKHNNLVDMEISNVISWELIRIKATKEEIKGLVDFLDKFIIDEEK